MDKAFFSVIDHWFYHDGVGSLITDASDNATPPGSQVSAGVLDHMCLIFGLGISLPLTQSRALSILVSSQVLSRYLLPEWTELDLFKRHVVLAH